MLAIKNLMLLKETQDLILSYVEKTAKISLNNSRALSIMANILYENQIKIANISEKSDENRQKEIQSIKENYQEIQKSFDSTLSILQEISILLRKHNEFIDNIQEGKKNG